MWFLIFMFAVNPNFGTPKSQVSLPNMQMTDFDKDIEVYQYSDPEYAQNFAIFYKNKIRKTAHFTDTIVDEFGFYIRFKFDSLCLKFNGWKETSEIRTSDSADTFHSCLERRLCSWKKMFEKDGVVSFVEVVSLHARNEFMIYTAIEDAKYNGMLGN